MYFILFGMFIGQGLGCLLWYILRWLFGHNAFQANISFLYLVKTSEKQRFLNIVSEYKKGIFKSSRSQMFFKIGVLKNFYTFGLESLFNKVSRPEGCKFIKERLQRKCFSVHNSSFLGTAFFIEHLRWLLLKIGLK